MSYKKLNIIVGWVTFVIAAITYMMTMEPTASFWDCGEFITTAFKLEVGHPPGAPLFMLVGRLFTLFANSSNAAWYMNILSTLASAFTILFLFWTITHLTKRLLVEGDNELTLGQTIVVLGSGLVGALAYTYSDTFWFSAVEAEVYATSSLFTALVFWAILKWENVAHEPYANRWLILICYLAGLSIGVHLLNLLAIPAIVFVYYYKHHTVTNKGITIALLISGLILGFILYGIIPGFFEIASWFELLFVNVMGLPFNSGTIFYLILLAAAIAYGIYYTHQKKMVIANTIILCVTVVIIGYSTYFIVPIRSAAKPPMDQNSPDNVFGLISYLNREQYGDRPLVYGQYYNSPLDNKNPYVDDKVERRPEKGRYVISEDRKKPNYASEFCSFFPRMWSKSDPRHIEEYKRWGKINGYHMTYKGNDGETETIEKPTFGENLRFFFHYQVGFMYLRYFMWNFVGRQNDIQGQGELLNGNWISGINFIDEMRLGNQDNLPLKYQNNWGRNKYYFLPLLLGLMGIFFQYVSGRQGKRDLWIVTLLFIATGLAIVVYLNQYPLQPRERDYAFAGSFYAFAIWIGMGVAGLYKVLKKYAPDTALAAGITAVCFFAVPVLMASENWDDHNRAGRTSCPDFGYNYLAGIEPQGVIFTNGDNDTYPLWYNQEVEGNGRAVKVCNLSYFQTDWYVSQMQRKSYESDPLPISFKYNQYVQGTRDIVYLMDDPRMKGKCIELGKALDFVKSDDPATKITRADNAAYLPVRDFYMVVDKQAVISNHVVPESQRSQIVDTMYISLKGSYITKDQLMLLDMLYHNNWKHGMYYAISVGPEKYMGLDKYFRLEGMAYRIVPIEAPTNNSGFERGFVDTKIMYDNLMNKFRFGHLAESHVYVDENISRMCTNLRSNFVRLADALLDEGKKTESIRVLDKSLEVLPVSKIPYDYYTVKMMETYINAGAKEKAIPMMKDFTSELDRELKYYFSLSPKFFAQVNDEIRAPLYFLNEMTGMAQKIGDKGLETTIKSTLEKYYSQYSTKVK